MAGPQLPAIFRERTYRNAAGQTRPNPLFVAARRTNINSGTGRLAASTTNAGPALAARTFTEFRTRIEGTPHGAVHCAIGVAGCGSGLMGDFATAGGDPIFWLHHGNIDRLYEQWLRAGPNRMTTNQNVLDQVYAFPGPNGARVNRRARDQLTTTQLGYRYPAQPPARIAQAETMTLLVIEGVTVAEQPGAMFDVYLANADGAEVLVGTMDFFGIDAAPHQGHAAGRRFEFDATEAIATLGLDPKSRPIVSFEATTGLDNSTPATAGLNPKAGVRRGRVWFK